MLCRLSYAGTDGATNMPAAYRNCTRNSLRDAFDFRGELPEFLVDALVAAVDVIDAVDLGFAIGREAGKHQTRARAQIARHDWCAAQSLHTFDNGTVAFQRNVRA